MKKGLIAMAAAIFVLTAPFPDSFASPVGLCEIPDSLNTNVTAIIPMMSLPDTDQGIDAWVELYENKENGIAFYANVSSDD